MEPIVFMVHGRARPKERARQGPWGFYTPKTTVVFEKLIAWEAKRAGVRLVPGQEIRLEVTCWFRRRPWPDGDNVLKAFQDGLQRACPEWNDRFVVDGRIIHKTVGDGMDFECSRVLVADPSEEPRE